MPTQKASAVFDSAGNLIGLAGDDAGEVWMTGIKQNYIGQIATRCSVWDWSNGSNKQMMSHTLHESRESVSRVKVAIPNWFCALQTAPANGTEANNGASTTVKLSIEYPVGVFTQAKFAGQQSGTVPAGSTEWTDWIEVEIPEGAQFGCWLWTSNATGIVYNNNHVPLPGEGCVYGVTTPDLTASGGALTQATNIMQTPAAIIGQTNKRSVWIAGDSRNAGIKDTADTLTPHAGQAAKCIGAKLAYINGAVASDRVQLANANYAKRMELAEYCTDVVSNYGINDLKPTGGNRAAGLVLTDLSTFAGLFTGKRVFQCTITPLTTSTDGWATTGNQTVVASEAQRVSLNGSIRSGAVAATSGFFEVTDWVESARDSGLWKVPGYTNDGIHELKKANFALKAALAINPSEFV